MTTDMKRKRRARTDALNAAVAARPAWSRRRGDDPTGCSPSAQRHTKLTYGFEDGPWASVYGAGSDGWGWVVWDVDQHRHERFRDGYGLPTPEEALDAADEALDECVAAGAS